MLGTINAAGRLLSLFDEAYPEWGVTEAAEALGIGKSKTYYLLASLAEIGILRHTADSRYCLGWRVLALSRVLLGHDELWALAREVMKETANLFGESVWLATLEGDTVVFVGRFQGGRPGRKDPSAIGLRRLACQTASGRVLMAHSALRFHTTGSSDVDATRCVNDNDIDPTTEKVRRELELVRKQGWAASIKQCGGSVAAPIRDHTGCVVASLSLTAPHNRFVERKDQFRSAVIKAASQISESLGYREWQRAPAAVGQNA